MLRPFALLVPALIPSWNFFDVIAPSPRIEFARLSAPGEAPAWRPFRPRPQRVSIAQMLGRLVWNPGWNDTLFAVSCAERLVDQPTAHSEDEIFQRLLADLGDERAAGGWITFRLVFVSRQGDAIVPEVLFEATPRALGGAA